MSEKEKCIKFLIDNGYKEVCNGEHHGIKSFEPPYDYLSNIDIDESTIVFINGDGDWLHININYYALLGALIHHRQDRIQYKFYHPKG
jgi:hypothetical protein